MAVVAVVVEVAVGIVVAGIVEVVAVVAGRIEDS